MTQAVIPESPPILDIDIDINEGKRTLYQAIYQLGRRFTWSPLKVRRAGMAAWQAHLDYRRLMSTHGLTPPQAIEKMFGLPEAESGKHDDRSAPAQTTIAVIGHPYLLYDEHINHRSIRRLEQAGNKVLTPEMAAAEGLESAVVKLVGRTYWTYEEEVVGAGGHYLQGGVDGVIGIMTFGCGPDSLLMDVVHRQASRMRTTPFMSLTLEEHTAEAGIVTRLEAFLDMIYRKRKKQAELCV
jgi:hypothetical protein